VKPLRSSGPPPIQTQKPYQDLIRPFVKREFDVGIKPARKFLRKLHDGQSAFGNACNIVVQRGKSTFWCLQDCCNGEKSGFWRLQDCCKHFQKHFGCYSALSKTFFWDKEPHFLSPNPHFITWETNISIESNQDQSKYTSHKYPRVFPRELSLCRK